MQNKKSLWGIIPGFFFLFIYGWEVFAGQATAKDWFLFVGGLAMFVAGLLLFFGIIKDKSNTTQKEDYLMLLGCSIGWGLGALFGWVDKECAFDHNTITNILVLVFMVVITIKQKHNLPNE